MSIRQPLLHTVTSGTPAEAWGAIATHLWDVFSAPIPAALAETEVVKRDRNLTELENVLSGSAWDLWEHFDGAIEKASRAVVEFWHRMHGGKAVLILDGLSLREVPWLLEQARTRNYTIHQAGVRGAELPSETTPFANALGFRQRSALENNQAGSAHQLTGADTEACDLPWQDCMERVGNHAGCVFWHHWPDERLHDLSKPGEGVHKLARESYTVFASEAFWQFITRLTTGRRLVITSDHGYAACGHFPDLVEKDQVAYMRQVFKNGRTAASDGEQGAWVPPIDLRLTTVHGTHQYVLGRRKWRSPSGYPTLHHGGLSLLEVFVPYVELS